MNELIRQAQMMQQKMLRTQEEIGKKEVESSVGGGMVTVKANCSGEILAVSIDKAVLEDVDMLQDLVMSAVNEVLKEGKDVMQAEMAQITGGMKIPGLF
ncbi:MAG: YbaB/EbfC family nucleoid-associated protein [Desulfomicrobium sp.]|nr:YbaB/EbfC family nucleoid-associated protein [Pseudomonadota bacterium]MBV1711157.1 YbaB/EbfC family nucleoid-associated protein [Desulfomicrobium sp.]MBU4569828.1 YbaB/EbfC family nucleoid-associated protein [Pseudomonadota bacterium]MBU4594926.1 YbaB/EbfC family nucleoid-associated protein [Pseudomonadota bacterium]MBV1718953.1 YbaB/EbfC family nucleoid-associated protein [Desulfomicrobium sp.]